MAQMVSAEAGIPGGVSQFIVIILAGVIGAKLAERLNLPRVLPLIISGYLLGPEGLNLFDPGKLSLTFDVLAFLIIPLMLFNEGMHIDTDYLRLYRWPILLLATAGVIITMLGLGVIAYFILGLNWVSALLLGAVLAATDPGAVIAVTKGLDVSKPGPITIVEAESAFNDATSVVLTTILMGVALGGAFSFEGAILDFSRKFFGGILIGFGIALASLDLVSRGGLTEHMVYLSIVIFFIAYSMAEFLGTSGITSAVVAGIVTGGFIESRLTPLERARIIDIWEHITFLSEVLLFLVIGAQIKVSILSNYLIEALVIIGAMMLLARPAAVYLSTIFSLDITDKERTFITAVGARGAIPAALAGLAVVKGVPGANEIFGVTLTAVIISLIVVSLTARPIATKTLGTLELTPFIKKYYINLAKMHALKYALRELNERYREGTISFLTYDTLRSELEEKYRKLESELGDIEQAPEIKTLREEEEKAIRRLMLETQINAIEELRSKNIIPEAVYKEMLDSLTNEAFEIEPEMQGASPIRSFLKKLKRYF